MKGYIVSEISGPGTTSEEIRIHSCHLERTIEPKKNKTLFSFIKRKQTAWYKRQQRLPSCKIQVQSSECPLKYPIHGAQKY